MFAQTERLKTISGADLALHSVSAVGAEKGVLLINHGLSEHSLRYARLASIMASGGFHVYAHDHRGHGQTTASDASAGRFAARGGHRVVLTDVMAVRQHAASRHPGLPVILFGHSMGGLIALNAAEEHPGAFDALSVWNSNFNPGLAGRAGQLVLAIEKMLKGSDVPSDLLTKLTFGAWSKSIANRKTDFDWLSHDEEEVARYVADPLCGSDATVSLWIDLFRLSFSGANPQRLRKLSPRLPIYLVGGGEDPATNGGRETRWLSKSMADCGLPNVTTQIYPGMRHETLNEVGRERAMQAFLDWCLSVTANRT